MPDGFGIAATAIDFDQGVNNGLRDQIMFLHRVGFDSFDVTHEGTIAALRDGKIRLVRNHYQPAAREYEAQLKTSKEKKARESVPHF